MKMIKYSIKDNYQNNLDLMIQVIQNLWKKKWSGFYQEYSIRISHSLSLILGLG